VPKSPARNQNQAMNDDEEDLDDDAFPWEHVEASRNNQPLQLEHPVAEARQRYAALAKPCPQCRAAADKLSWFYFESPAETWEHLCGRAGWLTVCDHCRRQVDFFLEILN
jgi:hypothetical protein